MVEMSTADMTKEINRLEGEISEREARIEELCRELKDEQTAKMRSQIDSLKAENKRLEKTVNDMIFLLHNPNGAIYESVKESECKESPVNLEPSEGLMLQVEIEAYKRAFENEKKKRDCQIAEYKSEIERLQNTIDELDSALYTTFGIRHTDFKNHLELAEALEAEKTKAEKQSLEKTDGMVELPVEPIAVAEMLINATFEYELSDVLKELCKRETNVVERYTSSELRQIAEHLIVYCNHAEKDDEK